MSECLFSSVVPIFVRTGGYGIAGSQLGAPCSGGELGRRTDSVLVELSNTSGINGRRVLETRLSDVNDPFFLWNCVLSEEEFYVLRREQNLLVDYHRFPYKLVELVQQCIAHGREDRPLFAATLQVQAEDAGTGRPAGATLSILESTSFRQIVHLALRFTQPSEQDLKRHLGSVVRHYKDEIKGLKMANVPLNRPQEYGGMGRIDLGRQPSMPYMPPPATLDEQVHTMDC